MTLIRRVGTPWPWRVVAMPVSRDGVEPKRVEIMPFGRSRHRSRALAGGEANHPAFRRRAQMRRQHDVGMRGRDGRIEYRTQEGTPVGHVLQRGEEGQEVRLSIQSPQKKTPAGCPRGLLRPANGPIGFSN